jgi:putative glutamine amidotransferase
MTHTGDTGREAAKHTGNVVVPVSVHACCVRIPTDGILTMPKPVILITVGLTFHHDYLDAVARAGGRAELLTAEEPIDAALTKLAQADGLLLSGGGDVDPALYGAVRHVTTGAIFPARDALEIALARAASAACVPTLGICRGMQVMNVALGGTLLQDIPDLVPGHCSHDGLALRMHTVAMTAGSLPAEIVAEGSLTVNSRHHQAALDVAPGLRTVAVAEDGVIEALVAEDGRPLLGLQWHPETPAATEPAQQAFFDWLVRMAAGASG